MRRRRIILFVLALLLVTFSIAVQRDTFLRRWCLPAPRPASQPPNVLGRVVDEFSLSGITHNQAIHQLEQRIGVPIRFEQHSLGDELIMRSAPCTVRGATVEQLLSRILIGIPFSFPRETFGVAADGSIIAYDETIKTYEGPAARSVPEVARIHMIDPVLADPDASWLVIGWDGGIRPRRATQRRTTQNGIDDRIRSLTRHFTGPRTYVTSDPALRFGDRWLIVTTPQNHWMIGEIMREEIEARRAATSLLQPQPAAR